MNLNKFAIDVTLKEAKKRQVSIAQVKEIMKIVFEKLAKEEDKEVLKLIKRYKKSSERRTK